MAEARKRAPAKRRVPPVAPEPVPSVEPAPSERFPPRAGLPENVAAIWVEIIDQHHDPARIAGPDLEAYCGQVAIERDAAARVAREGLIVANERGRPEPHPAIALQRAAQKELRDWGDKFRGRPKRAEGRGRG